MDNYINQTAWLRKQVRDLRSQIESLSEVAYQIERTADVIDGLVESTISNEVNIGFTVATIAEQSVGSKTTSGGYCLKAVQDILDKAGIITQRVASAYLAPEAFKKSDVFNTYYKESTVVNVNLDLLPPGSIIVFNKTSRKPHGHVEIKSFDKSFISDYRQFQRRTYDGNLPMVIFYPKS